MGTARAGGRQSRAAHPPAFWGALGATLHPDQFSLQCSAGACSHHGAILYPANIREKLYNCLKCTQRIRWASLQPLCFLERFSSLLFFFFSEGFNCDFSVSRGRRCCWTVREELRGRLASVGTRCKGSSHTRRCTKGFSSEPYFTVSVHVLPD